MPDREGAVIGYGEEAVSAIGTYLRMANGTGRIEGIYLFAKSAVFFIERNAYQGIFQSLEVLRIQPFPVGYTIIYIGTIRREGRESLQLRAVTRQGRQGVHPPA